MNIKLLLYFCFYSCVFFGIEHGHLIDSAASMESIEINPEGENPSTPERLACSSIKRICSAFIEQDAHINEATRVLASHGRGVRKSIIKKHVKIFRTMDERRSSLKKWLALKSLLLLVAAGNTSYGIYKLVTADPTSICEQWGIGTLVNLTLSGLGIVGPWLPIKVLRPFSIIGDIRELSGLNQLETTLETLDQQENV